MTIYFFLKELSQNKQRKYFFLSLLLTLFPFDNVSSLCASAEWTLLIEFFSLHIIKIVFVTIQGSLLCLVFTSVSKKVKLQKAFFLSLTLLNSFCFL